MDIREKLTSEAGLKAEERDIEDAKRSARISMLLKTGMAFAAILFLFSFQTQSVLPYITGGAALVLAVAYYGHRTVFSGRLRGYLTKDCDPDRFLSYYCAMLTVSGRQKKWENHIYNVAEGLFYKGAFEKAGSLLTLFETECRSAEGDFRHDLLSALLANHDRDAEKLQQYVKLLQEESATVRLNAELCDELDEAAALPGFLKMEMSGRWADLYQAAGAAKFYNALPLGELKRNVYLAKAASGMGDTRKAEEHLAYIREHGGTTFYPKELL